MAANKIRERWIDTEKVDKFTKITSYTSESILLQKERPNLSFRLIYHKKDEEDVLQIKLHAGSKAYGNETKTDFLQEGRVLFLLDDDETIKTGKEIAYDTDTKILLDVILYEELHLEIDIAFLTKLVSATKIEYRIISGRGITKEGQLEEKHLFAIRGFYNGLFDSELWRDELLSQIDLEEKNKLLERKEELKKRKQQAERRKREEKRRLEDKEKGLKLAKKVKIFQNIVLFILLCTMVYGCFG